MILNHTFEFGIYLLQGKAYYFESYCSWCDNQMFSILPLRFMRQKRVYKTIPITPPTNPMKKEPCYSRVK